MRVRWWCRPPGGGGGPSLGDRPPGGGGGPYSLGWGTTRGGGGYLDPETDSYCCRTIAELLQLCQEKNSSGSIVNATSTVRNPVTGYVVRPPPKVPAQIVVATTGGSIEKNLAARGDRSDFAECRRRPKTGPGHSGRSTHRWSGRGRQPVTSSRRRWLQGKGRPSPPRPSEDGIKILWVGIYGRSRGWRGQRECALAMGREQSWSPHCWQLHRPSRRALLKPSCRRRAWWKTWARYPRWYDRPTGT